MILSSTFANINAADLANWANIATIISVVVAFVTLGFAVYEYLRRKKEKIEDNRPYIIVLLEPSEASMQLFNIIIKNIGMTSAKNIRIHFSPDHNIQMGTFDQSVNELNILKNISFLPPDKEISVFFGSYVESDPKYTIKKQYSVDVSYSDIVGREYNENTTLDPREYENASRIDTNSIHDGVKTLNKIQKTLSEQSDALKDISSTLTKSGLRIRNLESNIRPLDRVASLVTLYRNSSENELWLQPLVYDLQLEIKRARDGMLQIKTPTKQEEGILATLNDLVGIDKTRWFHSEKEIEELFDKLEKEIIENKK